MIRHLSIKSNEELRLMLISNIPSDVYCSNGYYSFPNLPMSVDHVTLVTVDDNGVIIANLLMSGILDKTGQIPLDGDDVCFEAAVCGGRD